MVSLARKEIWFRDIFHLIGILGESPFVSKLRKAESGQHSPTRGRPQGASQTLAVRRQK